MEKIEIVEKYFPGTKTLWERYEIKDGKVHGTKEWFYESGAIRHRSEYVEGKRHGIYEWFYSSGAIMVRAGYVDGKRHETYEKFYESGEIECRTGYVEDRTHGTSEGFYKRGEIMSRTEHVDGKLNGPHKKYNPKGDLILDIVYEDGRQINIKDSLNVVNLDKIIDFLDELPTEKFYFAEIRSECGSTACAVGWFPNIFPEVEYTSPYFRLNSMGGLKYEEVASFILNVSEDIAKDLFSPRKEISELFPTLPICGDDATPKEVSAKLKAFKELVMVA